MEVGIHFMLFVDSLQEQISALYIWKYHWIFQLLYILFKYMILIICIPDIGMSCARVT